jgi:hypothetical protein
LGNFEQQHCQWVAQVVFRAEMVSAQGSALESALEKAVESVVCVGWEVVHLHLCISRVSLDCLGCHFDNEGIRPFDFDEVLLGVLLSQLCPCCVLVTQQSGSFLSDFGARFVH